MHPGKNHKLFTSELQFESGQIRLTNRPRPLPSKNPKRKKEKEMRFFRIIELGTIFVRDILVH